MFYPFKPRSKRDPSQQASERLTQKIRKMQQSWAQQLNQRTSRAPNRRFKVALIMMIITFCLIAALLIYRGVSGKSHGKTFRTFPSLFGSISVPKGPTKLQRLERYLDSLERAIIKDSIDSVNKTKSYDPFKLH